MAIVVILLAALPSAACGNQPTAPTSSPSPPTPPAQSSTTTRLSTGRSLSPGTYETFPSPTTTACMFDFSGGGRSCGSGTTGSLTIHEIAVAGDALQRLRASFVLNCGGSPTVRGDIVVLADPWR
jgi:hypothetical protein